MKVIEQSDEQEPVARALTWRTMLAFVFTTFVVQGSMIYYALVTNMQLPYVAWITIVLWSGLAAATSQKLTRQELFILLAFQPVATLYAFYFMNSVKNVYMATSEASRFFGIYNYLTDWCIPYFSRTPAYMQTKWILFHPDWLPVMGIWITSLFLGLIADIAMGYFCYQIFVVSERLDFPLATAQASTVITLADRPPDQMRSLMVACLAGILSHFFMKFLPFIVGQFITGGVFAYTFLDALVDFTPYLDYPLPGATFALPLDPLYYVPGFILPINVCAAQLIGALAYYFIGSHLITRFNLWPPESPWTTGWGIGRLIERSTLYFYTSITIGLSLAATFVPMILRRNVFLRGFRAFRTGGKSVEEGSGRKISLTTLLILYFGATLSSSLLIYVISPDFPVWLVIIFTVGASFFASFLSASSAGVTFTGFQVPYLRELMIFYSGTRSKTIWFTPLTVYTGGANIAQAFKQADLCEVSHGEYLKVYIFLVILGLSSSFIFVSLFWYISPMPSSAYPATIINWPVDALTWTRTQVWVWSGYLFRSEWILGGLALGSIIQILSEYLHAPYFLVSFITGTALLSSFSRIPVAFAQFVGSVLISRFVVAKIGRDRWFSMAGLVVLGFILGDTFMEMLRGIVILISRSMWILPY